MANQENLVFVYGSLRKGYWNHEVLGSSEYRGDALTVENYVMRAVSYPFVTVPVDTDAQHSTRIFGELYSVSDKVMKDLDRLEGHPTYYERKQVPIEIRGNGTVFAWMYICDRPSGRIVPTGNYSDFKSPGEI